MGKGKNFEESGFFPLDTGITDTITYAAPAARRPHRPGLRLGETLALQITEGQATGAERPSCPPGSAKAGSRPRTTIRVSQTRTTSRNLPTRDGVSRLKHRYTGWVCRPREA
jgi:hypothetical protein